MDAVTLALNLRSGYRTYGAGGFLRILAGGRVDRQSTWARYTEEGLSADERWHFYPRFRAHRQADGATREAPP